MKKVLSFISCNVNVKSTSYKLHLFVFGVLNLKPGTTLLRALNIERQEEGNSPIHILTSLW